MVSLFTQQKVTANRTQLHSYTDVMYFGGQVPVKDLCQPTKHAMSHPQKS